MKNYQLCDCCKERRMLLEKIILSKRKNTEFFICKECKEELKWTQAVMRLTASKLVEENQEKYSRATQFSVSEL